MINMSSVGNTNTVNSQTVQPRNSAAPLWKPNTVIKATVTERTGDKVSLITKDNYIFEAVASAVKGDVGDELTFRVVNSDKDSVSLKQIMPVDYFGESMQQKKNTSVFEILKQSNLIHEENVLKPDEEDEEQQKTAEAVTRIKRQLSYAADNASENAIRELLKSGLSLQKIDLNVLSTVMHEIEKKPVKELPKDAPDQSHKDKEAVVKALHAYGLPINNKNIGSMENVITKSGSLQELEEPELAAILRAEKPLTLDNAYIYKRGAKEDTASDKRDIDWKQLKPQVEQLFDREGIEKTKDNYKSARFLIENDLPINKENMDILSLLTDFSVTDNMDALLSLAAGNISTGKNPAGFDILSINRANSRAERLQSYGTVIKSLPDITDKSFELLAKRQVPFTLRGLINAIAETDIPSQSAEQAITSNDDEAVINTAKLQLAEIRLKLTYEAAYRLTGKDIDIDIMPLKEAVEALRTLDKEGYSRNVRIMGGEPGNSEQMSELYQKLSQIQPLTYNVFGDILQQRTSFTISGIHNSVSQAAMAEQAAKNYEIFATVPRARYGDSFSQVRDQFAPFLESMYIDATNDNIRAAVILSRNNIDITQEELTRTKLVDAKINAVINRLHPNIAASMIKEGINPVELHIDEVLAYIDKFNGMYGDDLGDKIAQYIMEIDDLKDSGKMRPEDREGIIAIYRMLNQLQKNDGAAIGTALKAGSSLTLGNLLESAKYYQETKGRNTKIDAKIDDSFGALDEASHSYIRELLHQLTDTAEPARLHDLMKDNDLLNMQMESLLELMTQDELGTDQPDSEVKARRADEMLQELLEASPAVVYYMEKNNIPPTIQNIIILQELVKDPFFTGRQLNKLRDISSAEKKANDVMNKKESLDNIEGIDGTDEANNIVESLENAVMDSSLTPLREGKTPEDILHDLEKTISAQKDKLMDNISSSTILTQLNVAQNAVKMRGYMNQHQSSRSYTLPIKLHDGITDLNMYVLNDRITGSGSIFMSLETGSLGTVQAYFTMEDNNLSVQFTSDNPGGLSYLQDNSQELTRLLADTGLSLGDIGYSPQEKRNILAEEVKAAADTRTTRTSAWANSNGNTYEVVV